MKHKTGLLTVFLFIFFQVAAQQFYFPKISSKDSSQLAEWMPALAVDVIKQYKDDDREEFLNNLFRLQVLAGEFKNAIETINELRNINKKNNLPRADLFYRQQELYAKAKQQQQASHDDFAKAFRQAFITYYSKLDDKDANYLRTAFLTRNGVEELKNQFEELLNRYANKDSLTINEAMQLCGSYELYQLFKNVEPVAEKLLKEDENNRYIIQDSILINTSSGSHISAIVMRKRGIDKPQPVVLEFTIYTGAISEVAKDAVVNGYIGMIAFTRGKRFSADEIIPYEFDGEDCADVINWIAKQPWCNGKVGMYGGSYNGFTQWAATKHLPPALKTIVPSASAAPGLDVPMMNNVFQSFVFPWSYYVSNNRFLDYADYNDSAKWDSLYKKWYASGKPYRLLDSLTGRGKNKIFQSWIAHPGYDKYWQKMIPYKEEFSKINIPVLSTTGYYDGGQVGAMYYFREHNKYHKQASHYLVIGPYSHYGSQGFLGAMPEPQLLGYKIDSVANIPIHDIIFQWLDYILKDGKKPAILKDKVNYEVMGANKWKHASSLSKINNDTKQFYLGGAIKKDRYSLSMHKPVKTEYILQQVDFSDRKTINNYDHTNKIVADSIDLSNGLLFMSEPFDESFEFNGNFSGKLHFSTNKKDMDYSVNVFELMPNGKYFYLTYFMGRASYAANNNSRKLLAPGKSERISFTNSYMTSKKISKGSRLVILLNINKSPYEQINCGTGKDVSDEKIEDAKNPMKIRWYNDSYIKIPIWKG
jgi:uncharacterized protein